MLTGESELSKLKVDLDEVKFCFQTEKHNFVNFQANIAHEGTLAALRQKHNNSMASLGEQIDAINKVGGDRIDKVTGKAIPMFID